MYGNVRVASRGPLPLATLIPFRTRLELSSSAPGGSELGRREKTFGSGSRRIGLFTRFLDLRLLDLCLAERLCGCRIDDGVLFDASFVRSLRNERRRVFLAC